MGPQFDILKRLGRKALWDILAQLLLLHHCVTKVWLYFYDKLLIISV